MAKDKLTFKILNSNQIDIALGMLEPSVSSRIINASLKKAGEAVVPIVKREAPISDSGTSGNVKYKSRNHTKGTLRRSIKYGLKARARPNDKTFIASIFAQDGKKRKADASEDGWYSHMVRKGRKGSSRPSGRGSLSGFQKDDFMARGARKGKGKFNSIMTLQFSQKLTKALQKKLNNKLK